MGAAEHTRSLQHLDELFGSIRGVRAWLAVETNDPTEPRPDPWLAGIGWTAASQRRPCEVFLARSVAGGWRERFRGVVMPCRPPVHYDLSKPDGNTPIVTLDSKLPKPWAIHHANCPWNEVSTMLLVGEQADIDAYLDAAEMAGRLALNGTGTIGREAKHIYELSSAEPKDIWTLIVFRLAWSGNYPTIDARRKTWINGGMEFLHERTCRPGFDPARIVPPNLSEHIQPAGSWWHYYSMMPVGIAAASQVVVRAEMPQRREHKDLLTPKKIANNGQYARVIALHHEGLSYRQIGKELKMASSTVGDIVKRAGLTGHNCAEIVRDVRTSEENLSIRRRPRRQGNSANLAVRNRPDSAE